MLHCFERTFFPRGINQRGHPLVAGEEDLTIERNRAREVADWDRKKLPAVRAACETMPGHRVRVGKPESWALCGQGVVEGRARGNAETIFFGSSIEERGDAETVPVNEILHVCGVGDRDLSGTVCLQPENTASGITGVGRGFHEAVRSDLQLARRKRQMQRCMVRVKRGAREDTGSKGQRAGNELAAADLVSLGDGRHDASLGARCVEEAYRLTDEVSIFFSESRRILRNLSGEWSDALC
jgi:hypothetical protein